MKLLYCILLYSPDLDPHSERVDRGRSNTYMPQVVLLGYFIYRVGDYMYLIRCYHQDHVLVNVCLDLKWFYDVLYLVMLV